MDKSMTKVSKRRRGTHKRKQELSKRKGLLYKPRRTDKSFRTKSELISKSEAEISHKVLPTLDEIRTRTNDILTQTEHLVRSVSQSFGYTVNFLNNLASICISSSRNKLNRAANRTALAVNERKDAVHLAISTSMYIGYRQLKKAVHFVGDVIFPSRPYKRKLDEMCDRLEEVENELKKLKRDAMEGNQLNQQTVPPLTNFPSISNASTSSCPLPTVPPPVPPPPPPPPPPICKPAEVISFKKLKINEDELKKTLPKIGITLKDLTSVKLRKVVREDRNDKENISSPLTFGLKRRTSGRPGSPFKLSSAHPFISLKDIKKVTLRKTETNTSRKSRSPGQLKIAFLKTNLRKVHVQRSPGGTPSLKKSRESHGEGLTPIMTRALQRKFKFANPPSPNELSFEDTSCLFDASLQVPTRSSPRGSITRSPLTRSPRCSVTKSSLSRSSPQPSPLTHIR